MPSKAKCWICGKETSVNDISLCTSSPERMVHKDCLSDLGFLLRNYGGLDHAV